MPTFISNFLIMSMPALDFYLLRFDYISQNPMCG